jgi:hypothetical protein
MVLSDRFGSQGPQQGLLKRTLVYVAGFGLGSLLIAGLLSFALVSIAEAVLERPTKPSTTTSKNLPIGAKKPASKAPAGRAKPAPPKGKK